MQAENKQNLNLKIAKGARFKGNFSTRNLAVKDEEFLNILKEFPIEAKLDANFTPIDSTTSSELLELSVEETIREKLEDNTSEDIRDLIRLLSSKRALVIELQKMIDKRSTVLRLENEIYNKSVQQIAEFFRETFVKYFDIIFLRQCYEP